MSVGVWVIRFRSTKQRLNTEIYIESDLVGSRDYVPYNIWYIMVMNHRGYLNKPNTFFRYNQSEKGIEINGENPCTGKSHHVDI